MEGSRETYLWRTPAVSSLFVQQSWPCFRCLLLGFLTPRLPCKRQWSIIRDFQSTPLAGSRWSWGSILKYMQIRLTFISGQERSRLSCLNVWWFYTSSNQKSWLVPTFSVGPPNIAFPIKKSKKTAALDQLWCGLSNEKVTSLLLLISLSSATSKEK